VEQKNQQGKLLDEEAIPPQELSLKTGGENPIALSLMLNVPSRSYLLKNPKVTLQKGSQSSENSEKIAAFLELSLPAERGVFTVVISRRHGEKTWENPDVKILADPTSTTSGKTRIINLSSQDVGLRLGSTQKLIKPDASVSVGIQTKMKLRNAILFAQGKSNEWVSIRRVNAQPRAGLVQTIICYHGRPSSKKINAIACHQRIETIASLKAKIVTMDKENQSP